MSRFEQEHYYDFSVKEIYDIVIAVDKYPEFLPWCKEAMILSRDENSMLAKLVIEFKGMRQEYTSKVEFNIEGDSATVTATAIDGPFNYLTNVWEIKYLDDVTKVNFLVDFEFKLSLLDKLISAVFFIAYDKMLNAFEGRAEDLYSNEE